MKKLNDESNKLFVELHQALREQLFFILDMLHPLIRADVILALEEPGKILAQSKKIASSNSISGTWALLPLLIAQHVSPDIDRHSACRIGVAVECFICALDLLDDVEDDDKTTLLTRLGIPRVLNVSTALLSLAHFALLSLSEFGVSSTLVVSLLETLQKATLLATRGQHRDILAEQRPAESFTSEECIEIAEGKAGTLLSLACRIGALYANSSSELLTQFGELGRLLGIASQLDNDSHDLYHILQYQQTSETASHVKTDITRRKKTLPIVLATHAMSALQEASFATDEEKQKALVKFLHEGIITTWGISLLYRERARDQLQQIDAQLPISHSLRLLLGFA